MAVLITLAIALLLAVWLIGIYNRLIRIRNQVLNGWRQIDVQLKRRHELIANLVNAVRGVMEGESETIDAVAAARSRAMTATAPADSARKEAELTEALGRLFALADNDPQIAADHNLRMLREELSSSENKIGFARQFYNDIATRYNAAIEVVPNNFVAGFGNFTRAQLFEA